MALWTPYAEDAALDLSKSAEKVKEENEYRDSSPIANQLVYDYAYPPYGSAPIVYPYYPCYTPYPVPANMSSVQMSPISGSSTCSGYESTPAAIASPILPVRERLPLPESPVSQTPRALYTDVDVLSDDPDFQAFEKDALAAMAEKNGGNLLANNPRMRRAVHSTNQDSTNDTYRKQRERNNLAAKQSRDRRKLREIHLALKVSYLKKEIASLQSMLATKVCIRCHKPCRC